MALFDKRIRSIGSDKHQDDFAPFKFATYPDLLRTHETTYDRKINK